MNDQPIAEPPSDPPEVTTLEEYLRLPGAKAEAFVALLKSGKAKIGPVDLRLGVESAKATPGATIRVANLVRASRTTARPIKNQILQLGRRVVQERAEQLKDWTQNEELTGLDEANQLLKWAKSGLTSSSKEVWIEADAVAAIGLAFLHENRELDPLAIIELVGDAYSVQRPSDGSDTRLKRQLSDTLSRSKPRQIAQFSEVARLQAQSLAEARDSASHEKRRSAKLEARAEELSRQLEALHSQLRSKEAELAVANQRVTESGTRLESVERVGAHDMVDLRARYRRVLSSDLKSLLSDATDALHISPPRPDFALQYLEELMLKIEGEIQWVNARSD